LVLGLGPELLNAFDARGAGSRGLRRGTEKGEKKLILQAQNGKGPKKIPNKKDSGEQNLEKRKRGRRKGQGEKNGGG